MKYIDADRLRTEIERRLDELNPKTGMLGDRPLRAVNPKTFPRESELEKVLYLIGSLQQEQEGIAEKFASLQREQESIAEKFARIVRGNLIGIDKEVQQKFEALYFEVTGNKMYGGYND